MSQLRYMGWLLFPLAAIFLATITVDPTRNKRFDVEDKIQLE